MTLKEIVVLLLMMVFPAIALASNPSQPAEEVIRQETLVNILEGAKEQNERVTVSALTLREILLQRLCERHAAGLDMDIPESFIENLSDAAIEEIFRQADEKGADSGTSAGDDVKEQREEFKVSEEPKKQSWFDYVKEWITATATALFGGATAWMAKRGFGYEDDYPPYYTESIGEGFVDPAILYQVIRGFGYSKIAACAILGNIEQESTFNTHANNKGKYIGLCQWQVEREEGELSSRWEDLLKFAQEKGWNPYDAATQLNFMYYEATTSWRSEWCTPEDFNKCQSIEEATRYWLELFEGAEGQELEERTDNAKKFYEQF